MRYILPTLFVLASALHAADEPTNPSKRKIPAASLLPNGSELHGVMIPRHNEQRQLVGSLRAELITLVNDEIISGKKVLIDFFNTDGSQKAHINLTKASFNQAQDMLKSSDPVTIESPKFRAKGKGLYYAFKKGQGFLTGPTTTWIAPQTETTMNTRPSLISAASIALLSQITAAPSQPDEKSEMISTAEGENKHKQLIIDARSSLRQDLEASEATLAQAKAFLVQAEIADKQEPTTPPVAAKPLDITLNPKNTVISCDGGMYFDADKGVLVYLKNVKINDPRFILEGANELKIYLAQKPQTKPKDPTKKDGAEGINLDNKFGDVDRIIATGAVRILQKEVVKGKLPVEASGAIFTYRTKTGEIQLSGGYPWVKQGNSFMRAKEPNLTLRIQKSGSFVTEGNWDMGGKLSN